MTPSLLVNCSHLAAYWLRGDPLGDLLSEAIDEGQALDALWHPLRAPIYVEPDEICRRARGLNEAWGRTGLDDEWSMSEARKVTDVYEHACGHGEVVVSVLEPPFDRERADRVIVPLTSSPPG